MIAKAFFFAGLLVAVAGVLSPQYCSLNNPDLLGVVNSAGALRLAWTQRVSAHFALHAARVEAIATGVDAFLEDLPEYDVMKGLSLPRGE